MKEIIFGDRKSSILLECSLTKACHQHVCFAMDSKILRGKYCGFITFLLYASINNTNWAGGSG